MIRSLSAVVVLTATLALSVVAAGPSSADAKYGNYWVLGKIEQEYLRTGGPGKWGNPVTAEANAARGGKFQKFSRNTSFYWHPLVSNGKANQVGGLIRDKWGSLNWENGVLRYPKTNEGSAPRHNGAFNHFEGGSIYWSPNTGAHTVWGVIRDEWASRGWEGSYVQTGPVVGYPTSDEYAYYGGRAQNFENTPIYWWPTLNTTLPNTTGGYGSYSFDYELFNPTALGGLTPADVKHEIMNNFDGYFTFTGCGVHIQLGDECRLDTTASPDGPVRVEGESNNGWMFKSLPGHPEGADRLIKFEFYMDDGSISTPNMMHMRVQAWGPLSAGSLAGPLNEVTLAATAWGRFRDNIQNRMKDNVANKIYAPCCGYGTVAPAPTGRSQRLPRDPFLSNVDPNAPVIREHETVPQSTVRPGTRIGDLPAASSSRSSTGRPTPSKSPLPSPTTSRPSTTAPPTDNETTPRRSPVPPATSESPSPRTTSPTYPSTTSTTP